MGQILHWGLLQGLEPVGTETRIDNELVKVRRFSEGDRRRFGKKVLG